MIVAAVASAATAPPDAAGMVALLLISFIVFIGIPGLIIYGIVRVIRSMLAGAQRRKEAEQAAAEAQAALQQRIERWVRGFAGWSVYQSPYSNGFLALNFDTREVCVGVVLTAKTYPFSAVTAVEPIRDGATVTSPRDTPRPSLFTTPYVIESIMLKAIESPTTSQTLVRELSLKITVEDRDKPVYRITFFFSPFPAGSLPTDETVRAAAADADKFHGLIQNVLRDNSGGPATATGASGDIDALQKLWDLRQAGAITDEEYAAQKAKLLAAG